MKNWVKTEDPNFVREPNTNAVINIDTNGYRRFKEERERVIKMQQLAQDVTSLQNDIGDIKQMLQQLINGKTNG
jgi:hypothetical protein